MSSQPHRPPHRRHPDHVIQMHGTISAQQVDDPPDVSVETLYWATCLGPDCSWRTPVTNMSVPLPTLERFHDDWLDDELAGSTIPPLPLTDPKTNGGPHVS